MTVIRVVRSRCRGGRAAKVRVLEGSDGYSLLELLVSLLVITLLLGGLYTVMFQTQASFESQERAMTLRQEARIALNGLAIELRMVGFDIGNLTEVITDARSNRTLPKLSPE